MDKYLNKYNLTPNNSVVIGSGILQALGIRKSKDKDVVVKKDIYDSLKETGQFTVTKNHGREIIKNGLFEIGTEWIVFDKSYKYNDLLTVSEVIDNTRYIKLDFLLKVKKSWVGNKTSRPKDIRDIELMEKYIEQKQG